MLSRWSRKVANKLGNELEVRIKDVGRRVDTGEIRGQDVLRNVDPVRQAMIGDRLQIHSLSVSSVHLDRRPLQSRPRLSSPEIRLSFWRETIGWRRQPSSSSPVLDFSL
ncbi:hypothetical protein U1Q18_040413 [Sarracenia purpurea var. burkii]